MRFGKTILLLIAVVATGLYIQLEERHRESTDEKIASARLALKFDPDRVRELRIESPAGLYILSRSNKNWRLLSPVNAYADVTAVMRIVDTMAELRKSEILNLEELRERGIDASSYGLDHPRATLTLKDDAWDLTVSIGKDSPGAHQLYMQRKGRDEIIVTDRDILSVLPASILDIRDRHLFNGQPGQVQRIELMANKDTWQTARDEQDQWIIEKPIYARGMSSAIRHWLDRLYEFRINDFVADSVAAGSLYGFDEPVAQVSLFSDDQPVPHVLKIGQSADVEETSHYATIAGQEAVFTVTDELLSWLKQDTGSFRDSRLLALPGMNIGYIQMTDGEQTLQLAKNTQQVWEVISPKRFIAHDAKLQHLLNAWTGARAERFIDPPYSKTHTEALEKAARRIRFARSTPEPSASGASATNGAAVIQSYDTTYILGEDRESDALLVTPVDHSFIIELSTHYLDEFSVNPLDYRNPVVMAQDPYAIRRITQKSKGEEISVNRTNGSFLSVSMEFVPDPEAINALLDLVSRLIAVRLIEEDSIDVTPYGLDTPAHSIILGLSGSAGINRVLLIGHASGENETYAMVQGTDLVFTLTDEAVSTLTAPVATPLIPQVTPAVQKEK